ncbi:MAG: PorT family protein [Prevotella sp.]|jgi:hypothetical protein|nr:PorT family protein [Prevotella sp.]
MKKLFLGMFLLCCCLYANAQGMRYGVNAGINLSKPAGNVDADGVKMGAKVGFRGEYDFKSAADGFYLSSGLYWSQKGYKSHPFYGYAGNITSEVTSYVNLNYLELPVHIGYKLPCCKNLSLFGEAGPYVGYAAWGKSTAKVDGKKVSSSSKIFGHNGFRRFDTGVGVQIGAQLFGHYQLIAGYERGFIQLSKDSNAGLPVKKEKYRNSSFDITLAYEF